MAPKSRRRQHAKRAAPGGAGTQAAARCPADGRGANMLAGRQDRMLRETAADWRIAVKALAAMGADELLARRTELARQAIRKGLAGVRELAETSTRSQAAAWQAIGARRRDNPNVSKKVLPRR